ncbi:MAG TPA: glycosyl hydrolase family 28-related protein [Bryobacteraceae bacterium]|nr:glycosyl hydrolase family 28-related protein [Bryobacteraceae bacterium]
MIRHYLLSAIAGGIFLLADMPWCAATGLEGGNSALELVDGSSLPENCDQGDVVARRDGGNFLCTLPDTWVVVGSLLVHSPDEEQNRESMLARTMDQTATSQPRVSKRGVRGTVSVREFGAKGDGITDDYSAIKAAADYICTAPGGTLVYPPGVYKIDRYRVINGPRRNDVSNIRYNGCNGVQIIGTGAKIDVTGSFHRSADLTQGPYSVSYSVGVIPFEVLNSSNFKIVGFELDGNVDEMSRDPGVVEGGNAGILTTNCKNYSIENVNVHHFHTDGITLGGNSVVADQGAVLRNVTASNNARQGLSIVQLRTGTILNSQFLNTGRTGGSYGHHEPAAGVDVEPERVPPAEDARTGLLTFDGCRFEENVGSQFISAWPERVEMISVTNSRIKATSSDSSPVAFLNAPATGIVSGNTFDLGPRYSVALAPLKKDNYSSLVRLTYRGNTFNLQSKQGIITASEKAPVDFLGNIVRLVSSAQDTSSLGLYYLDRVEANTFFVAGSGYIGSTGSKPWVIVYGRVGSIRDNIYSTDLTGSRQYKTVYYGTGLTVAGEKFQPAENFAPISLVQ